MHQRLEWHNPQEIKSVKNAIVESLSPQKKIEGIAVSSTVGYSEELRECLNGYDVIFLDHTTPIPIDNLYSTPETLGPDRLAASIGANALCPGSDILVIDMGTAITYDFVNAKEQYLGGNISPGIEMRFKALHDFTAKLPLVDKSGTLNAIGSNTEEAIRAGVILGVKHEVEGYIREFLSKNSRVSVFLTGGDSINFDDTLKKYTFAYKFLVQEGLAEVFHYNRPS